MVIAGSVKRKKLHGCGDLLKLNCGWGLQLADKTELNAVRRLGGLRFSEKLPAVRSIDAVAYSMGRKFETTDI